MILVDYWHNKEQGCREKYSWTGLDDISQYLYLIALKLHDIAGQWNRKRVSSRSTKRDTLSEDTRSERYYHEVMI
jgi:hypothetical protein